MCVHLYICVCITIIKIKNTNKEVMNLRWSRGSMGGAGPAGREWG